MIYPVLFFDLNGDGRVVWGEMKVALKPYLGQGVQSRGGGDAALK